jgi:hypothetical protein
VARAAIGSDPASSRSIAASTSSSAIATVACGTTSAYVPPYGGYCGKARHEDDDRDLGHLYLCLGIGAVTGTRIVSTVR